MDAWDIWNWIKKNIPGSDILEKILKKIGFLKDFETVYKTERKVKSFGNALKRIGVPFYEIVKTSKIKIPFVILFRQKGIITLPADKLRSLGFVLIDKSMGLYLLPPKKTIENNIVNGARLNDWLIKEFNLEVNPQMNIRFAILTDTENVFAYRHTSLSASTLLEALEPHLFDYLNNPIKLTIDTYKKKGKVISERQIIDATPIQHMFENLVDNKTFEIIHEKESSMLDDLLEKGEIQDKTYTTLAKINKTALKDCFVKHIGNQNDLDNVISNAIEMAEFVADKL